MARHTRGQYNVVMKGDDMAEIFGREIIVGDVIVTMIVLLSLGRVAFTEVRKASDRNREQDDEN